jgi:hypothetical protein
MKVVAPFVLNDTNITSSTAVEPAAGETAWSAGTSYTIGQIAYLATTHRLYKNALGGIDATSPDASITAGTSPARWLDVGATNKYAMFDLLSNAQTVLTSPLTVVITPGKRTGAIGLVGVVADAVRVSVTSSGITVYDTGTVSMRLRNTTRWSEYFFGTFGYKSKFGKFDLPMYSNAIITITLTSSSASVKCAGIVIGTPLDIGGVQYNAESNIIDYSLTTRDAFGGVTLVPRKTVPLTIQTVWLKSSDVGKVLAFRAATRATPVLWSGLTDPTQDYFESLFVLGFFRKFTLQIAQPKVSLCSLEIEGL